jgi:hypothetical protein
MVLFGAHQGKDVLGLAGSRKYVFGSEGASYPHSDSATPMVWATLQEELELPGLNDYLDEFAQQWSGERRNCSRSEKCLQGDFHFLLI